MLGTNERTNERIWSSKTKAVVGLVDGRARDELRAGVCCWRSLRGRGESKLNVYTWYEYEHTLMMRAC